MQQMTVQQALEQGYTHFFYCDEGNQPLMDLTYIDDEDIERGVELVEKEPSGIAPMTKEQLSEMVVESIELEHGGDMEIADLLKDVDYTPVLNQVNALLKEAPYYRSSGIKLIKG